MTTLIILNVYLLHPTNSNKLDKHGLSFLWFLCFLLIEPIRFLSLKECSG